LVIVVLAVVVLPLVDTVVVALVLPDLVVTVFVDGVAFGAATAGLAMIASAATELINIFIYLLLLSGIDAPAKWRSMTSQVSAPFQWD
jgi:hypothetical protein